MLPNRFPDGGEAPEYNTVDATLWYFHRDRRYVARQRRSQAAARVCIPCCATIIDWHQRGTRFGIRVDDQRRPAARRRARRAAHLDGREDRRLGRHAAHRQAGRDQRAVALRAVDHGDLGAAVERQRRGARATRLRRSASPRSRSTSASGTRTAAISTTSSMAPNGDRCAACGRIRSSRFRCGIALLENGARDVQSSTSARGPADARRAAQSRADRSAIRTALQRRPARARRGLSPGHGVELAARPVRARALPRLRRRRQPLAPPRRPRGASGEGCLGTVSEIFDGDAPYAPRGCFAQAWGVAETLRAWHVISMKAKLRPAAAARHADPHQRPASETRLAERTRLAQCTPYELAWKKWGPYLSRTPVGHGARGLQPARQRVGLLPARSRAQPRLSLGRRRPRRILRRPAAPVPRRSRCGTTHDPILKERLFGLTNSEGNHGEDVKELYYYLDATPTHSYLKMLYKYPQRAFPYAASGRGEPPPRHRHEPEYELIDTRRASTKNRYFDVFVEYAQARCRTTCSCASRCTTAGPRRRRCTCCRSFGSAIPGAGEHGVAKPRMALQTWTRRGASRAARRISVACRGWRGCRGFDGTGHSRTLLFSRQRDRTRQRLWTTLAHSGYCQRCLPRTRRARPDRCSESGARRHEGGRVVCSSTFPPAAACRFARGSPDPRTAAAVRRLRRDLRRAHPRSGRVLRRASSRAWTTPTRASCSARRSPE